MDSISYPFPHLLGIEDLEPAHIEAVLSRADAYAELNARRDPAPRALDKRTLINLFFEASTRTQASFELAAKRLGATVMNMSVKSSSVSKGETLLDTAATLNAMLPDILVVRHGESGAVKLLADKVNCGVVNAGDGWHEHPTQALLDALTMRRAFRARRGADDPATRLEGLTVAICGDVMHSRVARSNIFLQRRLGNRVRVAGPPTLLPVGLEALGVERCADLASAVRGADVVMMLRLQNERMDSAFIPSTREYFHNFGLDADELSHAAPDAFVMHPGPMNRGVEIDSELADDPARSVISTQVEMGVAVRMAVLELVSGNLPHHARRSERPAAGSAPQHRFTPSYAAAQGPARTLIQGARLIDPEADAETVGDLLIEGAEIAETAPGGLERAGAAADPDMRRIAADGLALAPGLVDLNVFIGEPGERHRESFGSAGESAVAGGVTTIVTQPDTAPCVDDPALLDFISQRVHEERSDHAMPHVFTMAALTRGLEGARMTEYEFLLEAGAVALSEGDKAVESALVFRRCLESAAAAGALVAHLPLEPALSLGASATESAQATRLGLPSAPAEAEAIMLKRDLALVALTGARYHAAQISTAASVAAIRRAKEDGLDVTAAASAAHLTLSEAEVGDYRTFAKVTPPLRVEEDRAALAAALRDGVVDCVVSAHRPQNEESKRRPFASAAAGAAGLETLLSAGLEAAAETGLSLPRLFRALSLAPAQRIGLPTGRLTPGAPADLVLFEPEATRVIDRRRLRSKSKNSPFDRRTLRGAVTHTFVDGGLVFLADVGQEQ